MSTDHVDGLVQMEEEGFEDELMVEYGTSEDEEMEKSEEVHVRSLPMEVWVQVFHYLPGPSLFMCEGVCRSWQHEVRHQVMTGCIPRRGLRLSRLTTIPGAVTEHRRRTWDTLSIMADRRVLLVGVGLYLPSGQTTICLDARPLAEPLRPIDVSTELDSSEEEGGTCLTLYGGKTTSGRPFRFLLEPGEWWELVLNIHLQKGAYDAMVRQGEA